MMHETLVQQIQDHLDQIATRAVQAIRQDEHLTHVRQLSEWELLEWAKLILRAHAEWPAHADDRELSARYEALGKQRFQESIPLDEWIRRMQHLKWAVVDWVRDQSFPQNAIDLYTLEEYEHDLDLFFDHLVFHIARGYEEARQGAALSA